MFTGSFGPFAVAYAFLSLSIIISPSQLQLSLLGQKFNFWNHLGTHKLATSCFPMLYPVTFLVGSVAKELSHETTVRTETTPISLF